MLLYQLVAKYRYNEWNSKKRLGVDVTAMDYRQYDNALGV
jgi:hypothetical protein